ncbi:K02A2.6-like, partial [Cordylochernes scorpioides]
MYLQIPPPEPVNFRGNIVENWRYFKSHWRNFSIATGLDNKEDKLKVATLLSIIGKEAYNIFEHLDLSDEQRNNSDEIINALTQHFTPKINIIYERSIFNQTNQETNESIEQYICRLRKLSSTCNYGAMTEEMIRDRLVLGIIDKQTKRQLISDPQLTLQKAIDVCKANESANKQIENLTKNTQEEVNKLNIRKKTVNQNKMKKNIPCRYCATFHEHNRQKCPAWNQTCRKCNKKNHWAKVCKSRMRTVQSLESQNSNDEQEDCYSLEYVSEISARKLMTKLELELNGYKESIICQIDTGATVNVLNFADLCKIMQDGNPSLKPSYIKLRCYGGEILKPRGQIKINCSHQSKQHPIVLQVIDHWEKPILSAETCQKLNLIEIKADLCKIESTWTKQDNLLDKYKDIFEGIGCLQGEYKLETDPTMKTHQGHIGINSSMRRARDNIFWPGMNAQMGQEIENCSICLSNSQNQTTKKKIMQNINPPEQFNFNNPNEWPNWIKRFERFRKASELKSKKEEEQVNALIYILGEKAEDALISFNLTEIEINNYETVVKKFEEHFIGKRNVIFERAQFNRRYQQDGEAVEEYIRVLHKMAENCNYGSLKEEMIRDRIVVGVKNLQLSEKLQLEPNLTLERAIQAACQTECVKQQQTILRSTTTQAANVDQVYEKKLPPRRFNSTNGKGDASKKSKFQKWSKPEKSGCIRCGASKFHPYKDCPAKEVKCHKCKKVGHFAKVCYNKTVGQVTQGDDYHFVGNIYENGQNSNDWKVYVKVDKIKILFKMDTGADVNIIPQEIYFKNFAHKKLCKPDIQLLGPRQVKLHVIGKFTALIEKDGRSIPGEIFVVPQLMQPLLSGKASESLNLIKRLQSIEKRNSLNPFEEYPKLFTGLGTLQGSYTIKLKDESQPHAIYTPRRIPIPLLNKTKEQLDQMVEKGVIEKVEQPTDWCAPMVIVPKPSSNDLRICVDLTALNKFVKREHYPIPSVEYTLAQMGGAKLFSKLDANSGFWQIPLSEESSSLTTFLTPFGRYRFKRLPFGISSAPEVFQRKMSNLLESQSGVNCHMDDIVIWGATQEEHDERLRCVLRKLQDSGLTLNKEKCIFSVKEIKFLGHLITERGVLPDPNKVQAIREFPSPSSISEVRRFLGMVNFTGKFIPDLSTILYPLNQLLVKRNDWRWDSAQEEAFEKEQCFYKNLKMDTKKAVAYASRTMSETEKRWAQIEKESLAIVWACERFQDYLMGNTFSIETDHKPLIPIFSTKNLDEMTPRIQRLRHRMMRYSYSIYHTPGKDIVVADALSRSPIKISHEKDLENEICSFVQQITSCPPFKDENMKEIWQYQNEERVCREIKDYCEKGWPTKNELSAEAKAFWCLRYEMSVIDGLLMRNSRIYIPKSLRSKVLNSLHEGHLGIEKCRGRARSSVWWPRISKEIGELVRNCPNCIEERSNPQQPLIVSDFPSRPWEKVGIDHFYLKGKYYLLIADYYSRFPELALLEDQTTHSTILHCKSIFARHGIPEEVRSDNGPQFGLEFKKFAKEYGFHHITSSPRFPQSNGFIESMVKNIKNQLKKGRDPYLSLLGYRTAPLENGYSPAELCMNRKLRTTVPTSPVQLQSRIPDLENLEMREKDQRHKKKTHFDIHHRARELPHLNKGTRVWVKDLRVPGVVLEDAGSPRSYIVNSPKGILRRNRFHLLPNPQGEKIDMEDEEMESPEMSQCFTSTGDNTTCDSEPRTFQRSPEPVKTRSGRVSHRVSSLFNYPNREPNTTIDIDSSPVQRTMSRRTRAILPIHLNLLKPSIPENIPDKISIKRQQAKYYYDRKSKNLPDLDIGQEVYVRTPNTTPSWSKANITNEHNTRSYDVNIHGRTYRRNRTWIKPQQASANQKSTNNQEEGRKESIDQEQTVSNCLPSTSSAGGDNIVKRTRIETTECRIQSKSDSPT